MTCALYARVSTEDQSCEMQIRELSRYILSREWFVPPGCVYVETASGAKADRPRLKTLMQDAREHRFKCVLVWKLDRWGRSMQHVVSTVQELTSLGIRFIAVTQGIDTDQSNPMANFLLQIMAAFAELERELIRERVNAGIKQAKANGVRFGPAQARL